MLRPREFRDSKDLEMESVRISRDFGVRNLKTGISDSLEFRDSEIWTS